MSTKTQKETRLQARAVYKKAIARGLTVKAALAIVERLNGSAKGLNRKHIERDLYKQARKQKRKQSPKLEGMPFLGLRKPHATARAGYASSIDISPQALKGKTDKQIKQTFSRFGNSASLKHYNNAQSTFPAVARDMTRAECRQAQKRQRYNTLQAVDKENGKLSIERLLQAQAHIKAVNIKANKTAQANAQRKRLAKLENLFS